MDKEVVVLMYNGISLSHVINVIRLILSCRRFPDAPSPATSVEHAEQMPTMLDPQPDFRGPCSCPKPCRLPLLHVTKGQTLSIYQKY